MTPASAIREIAWRRTAVAGLVGLALLVACTADDERDGGTVAPDAAAATAIAPATSAVERPNIAPLDCRLLVTTEDIEDALDIWNRPSGQQDTFAISGAETCGAEVVGFEEVFVRVGPGDPADFSPGARRLGVEGEFIPDIGDAAVWFGGPRAEGGGRQGALTVTQQGSIGGVVFHIELGRPELSPAELLDVAKALARSVLPRFPGVVIAPPPPEVIAVYHGPVDQSRQGFVQNLLAREADSEWTRAEGIVATLRYLVGEAPATEALRHPDLLDDSATGIVRLAQAYLDAGDDAEAVAEVQRLLDLLLVDAAGAASVARADARGPLVANRLTQEGCFVPFPAFGDQCFESAPVDPGQFGEKYVLWFPAIEAGEQWEGWVRGDSTIQDAIIASAGLLEGISGSMPDVAVWLSPYNGGSIVTLGGGLCAIQLNKGAQALSDRGARYLQQAVASALARCYVHWNYGFAPDEFLAWWEEGVSWYLSDVVYPDVDMEADVLGIPSALAGEELGTTLVGRSITTMTFFEFLDAALGLEGTLGATATIAESGLGAVSQVDSHLHEHARALTDGAIMDRGGGHPYDPPASYAELLAGRVIATRVDAFGTERLRVSVAPDQYACLEYPDAASDAVVASWRTGPPGSSEHGTWTDALPTSVQGQGVYLLTAADRGGEFSVTVTDVRDDPECEEESDSAAPEPEACPVLCDPSRFYFPWDRIRSFLP